MRVDGSTVSKVHEVRRLNTQVNPNELQTETWGRMQKLSSHQLH